MFLKFLTLNLVFAFWATASLSSPNSSPAFKPLDQPTLNCIPSEETHHDVISGYRKFFTAFKFGVEFIGAKELKAALEINDHSMFDKMIVKIDNDLYPRIQDSKKDMFDFASTLDIQVVFDHLNFYCEGNYIQSLHQAHPLCQTFLGLFRLNLMFGKNSPRQLQQQYDLPRCDGKPAKVEQTFHPAAVRG